MSGRRPTGTSLSPLAWLFATEAALLLAHEIDAAYWHEWDLFGLPGGVQLFVTIHIPLVIVVFWGFARLPAHGRGGYVTAFVLGFAGVAAAIIHGGFLLAGDPSFRLPVSLAVLAAGVLVGIPLMALSARELRRA